MCYYVFNDKSKYISMKIPNYQNLLKYNFKVIKIWKPTQMKRLSIEKPILFSWRSLSIRKSWGLSWRIMLTGQCTKRSIRAGTLARIFIKRWICLMFSTLFLWAEAKIMKKMNNKVERILPSTNLDQLFGIRNYLAIKSIEKEELRPIWASLI